jgi:hypothetical protein
MLSIRQAPFMEEGLGDTEDGVISSPGGEIEIAACRQSLCRVDGSRGFVGELTGSVFHAGMASSRRLARNGVSERAQSVSGKKTRLTLRV